MGAKREGIFKTYASSGILSSRCKNDFKQDWNNICCYFINISDS